MSNYINYAKVIDPTTGTLLPDMLKNLPTSSIYKSMETGKYYTKTDASGQYVEIPITDIPMSDKLKVPLEQLNEYTINSPEFLSTAYINANSPYNWVIGGGGQSFNIAIPPGVSQITLVYKHSSKFTMNLALFDALPSDGKASIKNTYQKITLQAGIETSIVVPIIPGALYLGTYIYWATNNDYSNIHPLKVLYNDDNWVAQFPNWIPSYNSLLDKVNALATQTRLIRYIRDETNGNIDSPLYNTWTEIQAYTGDGTNVALHKPVTIIKGAELVSTIKNDVTVVTNGDTEMINDAQHILDFQQTPNPVAVQIDLEAAYELLSIKVWHFNNASLNRKYKNHILSVSEDGVNWSVIWNSNALYEEVENTAGLIYRI